jgi:uncharacterized membrane protein
MGWHAPRIRRVVILGLLGLITFAATLRWLGWELAALAGWDLAAAGFIAACWEVILHADADKTMRLATREDETRRSAAALVLGASLASLLAVVYTLAAADDRHGTERTVYVVAALLTVVLSWTVVNTLYTLRYADAHYRFHDGPGVDFGGVRDDERADYRDFAYLAFTIGMCYQVSDQSIRSRHIRRTVLVHSLVSYVFGVVIIASTINAVAGLLGPGR